VASRPWTPPDIAIARELDIEASTLHDHWKGIYRRVAHALDASAVAAVALPGFEAGDRKAAVLHYVRHHPEELRPVDRRHFPGIASRSSALRT
jgi:hypothetical protein